MKPIIRDFLSILFFGIFGAFPSALYAQNCTPQITTSGSLCQNGQVVLTASEAASYLWSTGATTRSITITSNGTYWVKTEQADGCKATSATMSIADAPDASIEDPVDFFTSCSSTGGSNNFELTIENTSTTKESNKSYKIKWGDGAVITLGKEFENVSHTYTTTGFFSLEVEVTGESGCVSTSMERVFIGSNPSLGLASRGNTNDCLPATYTFDILNTEGNSPLTVYTIDFGDGTPVLTYTHANLPKAVTHTYEVSSKDAPNNAFTLSATATNPCGFTPATVGGIKISKGPEAGFSTDRSVGCVNMPVQLTDMTIVGFNANSVNPSAGAAYTVEWEILPATGWEYHDGNATTKSPAVVFTKAGEYSIKMTSTPASSGSKCSSSTIEKIYRIIEPATSEFDVTGIGTCAPALFSAQNKSTGGDLQYIWQVSPQEGWAFAEGFTQNSESPFFNFTKSGTYTISLISSNGCSSQMKERIVVIQDKPLVRLPGPQLYCGPQVLSFSETNAAHKPLFDAHSGTISNYNWRVTGPAGTAFLDGTTSNSPNPTINFSEDGKYLVSVVVTNGCGVSAVATQEVTIDKVPVAQAGEDKVVCLNSGSFQLYGLPAGGTWSGSKHVTVDGTFTPDEEGSFLLTYTHGIASCETKDQLQVTVNPQPSTLTAADALICPGFGTVLSVDNPTGTIAWYDAPISGKLLSGEADFSTPALEQTTTYYVQTTVEGGCTSIRTPVTVKVRPATPAPIVASVVLCGPGNKAVMVAEGNATAFEWYDVAKGGSPIFTGRTFETEALEASKTYYVQANIEGCLSSRTEAKVSVYPVLKNNVVTSVPVICVGQTPAKLLGNVLEGDDGNHMYMWESSITGPDAGFSQIMHATGIHYQPNALNRTTWFRRVVRTAACSDISNVVEIVVNTQIANNTVMAPQVIYAGQVPAPLNGSTPIGGNERYSYAWEYSADGVTYMPAPGPNTGKNYSPKALTQNTWFRRKVYSGGCETISNEVKITITLAIANNNIQADQVICFGNVPAPLVGSEPIGGKGDFTYLWEQSTAGPTTGWHTATASGNTKNYTPPALTQETWIRRVVISGINTDTSAAVVISVKPAMSNNKISTSQTICSGTSPSTLTGTLPSGGSGKYIYHWEQSTTGPSSGFTTAPGQNNRQEYSPSPLTKTTWFRRVVTSEACEALVSASVQVTITAQPLMPIADGVSICAGQSATLTAKGNGGRLEWYGSASGGNLLAVGSTLHTPSLDYTSAFYVQEVSQSCASVRQAVVVKVIESQVSAGEDVTVVKGRSTQLQASGGLTYSWFPATGMDNPNSANPLLTPEETTVYTVTATTAEGCTFADEVVVTVLPFVFVPNTFTPNRDGINDTWEIENITRYQNCRVKVFNQWGTQVFNSEGYKEPWDGHFKGLELPIATYYYIIDLGQNEKPLSGSVTIVK